MPRIQGGRPGPGSITFHVHFPPSMSAADIASIGDLLGPYVFFDDAPGGILCWADPGQIDAVYGDLPGWWEATTDALFGVGAEPDEEYEVAE